MSDYYDPEVEAENYRRWRQCPHVWKGRTGSYVWCVKERGHAGDHRGIGAQWNELGRVKPPTEKLPYR